MATERQIQQSVLQCVSIMVHYHDSERSQKSEERMAAEIQLVAGFVEELGFCREELDSQIVRPVESELIDRYGHEVGPRLAAYFLEAFENPGGNSPWADMI